MAFLGTGGLATVAVIGLFSLIFSLGVATLEGNYTANEYCGGDEVCYLEMTELCFNEDVFVYPMDGAAIINAQPTDQVDEVILYRGWGSSWRKIPLDTTCTGTWCGAPNSYGVAYSYAFRKDKCYDLRVEVYKPLNSTVSWKINPSGDWLPLDSKEKKDKPKIKESCTSYIEYEITNNCANQTNETICNLENTTTELTKYDCKDYINYKDYLIDYEAEGYNCTQKGGYLLCDSFIDGNGDGICQSGETCCTYTDEGVIDCKNGLQDIEATKDLSKNKIIKGLES